jgi:predicted polyphosphate/ATP-dependent NAD kinase
MRAAAILGLGCSARDLEPFQADETARPTIDWRIGMPAAADQADIILLFGGDGTATVTWVNC